MSRLKNREKTSHSSTVPVVGFRGVAIEIQYIDFTSNEYAIML